MPPPAPQTRIFTTRFARDTEARRIPCFVENVAGIEGGVYPALNSRNPSGSNSKRKRRSFPHPESLLPLAFSPSKRGFANFPETVLRFRKIRETLSSPVLSVPLCLERSGW
jgi:hypothetical protein